MSADRHTIESAGLAATIKADGAELCSLRDREGRELLWQAGPAWPRHSPVLFPIVGRLAGDRLLHRGQSYRMTQHGFARDRRFAWEERGAAACRLSLRDDAETRAQYPFAFVLELAYALAEDGLTVTLAIANPSREESLPASAGAHPAFRWPLAPGIPKPAHRLEFALPEPAPVRRLAGGLLIPEPVPSPIEGRSLALDETLFAADALILDRPASRSLRYAAPGGPALELSWDGFAQLGLWSKPGGAEFLCIEPWHGFASPVGWDGEFAEKPGIVAVPPGGRREFRWRVAPG